MDIRKGHASHHAPRQPQHGAPSRSRHHRHLASVLQSKSEVASTCPVVGCAWVSCCECVAAGFVMATARVDLLNPYSTTASSRSFLNSALMAITRAAHFSQNGLVNSTQCVKAGFDGGILQGCFGGRLPSVSTRHWQIWRDCSQNETNKHLSTRWHNTKSMMAIFAFFTPQCF